MIMLVAIINLILKGMSGKAIQPINRNELRTQKHISLLNMICENKV